MSPNKLIFLGDAEFVIAAIRRCTATPAAPARGLPSHFRRRFKGRMI